MQKTIKGDHMLLLRDEIYGFSSSSSSILCELGGEGCEFGRIASGFWKKELDEENR
jgi:hypothetical protein